MSQPIVLYAHVSLSPNPWKVATILEELGVPYKVEFVREVKKPPYTDKNPNGRVPTIEDPNTGIVLWESEAITEYLVDTYDKDGKLSYATTPEKYHVKQFLYLQVSGQGPYFGQASWFVHFHSEQVPSAIIRYQSEVKRVTAVLDIVLKTKGDRYLVGGKCTYADLSFVPWAAVIPLSMKEIGFNIPREHQHYDAWLKSLLERPSVKKVFHNRDAAITANKN